MIAINVNALRKSYGAVHALRGIDLSIEGTGQIVGLLGPNGAGKTTLVEILEGLRVPSSGTVSVLGLDPATASTALRARLGVQLQATAFMPELTVLETLRLYAALYPKSQPARGVLRRVDLEDKAGALVRTLSGGQKQRLALAMAMLHEPDLYILDEPTSGLDPIARRQMHDILKELTRDGKTVLISSHYLDEIEALADRVIILSAGTVVADGSRWSCWAAPRVSRRSGWRSRAPSTRRVSCRMRPSTVSTAGFSGTAQQTRPPPSSAWPSRFARRAPGLTTCA